MIMMHRKCPYLVSLVLAFDVLSSSDALVAPEGMGRRAMMGWLGAGTAAVLSQQPGWAREDNRPDSLNVDDYLRTGGVAQPMGVSGQAGKSRPETGVVLRDGSEVAQDGSGNVSVELVVKDTSNEAIAILTGFSSPWSLATGSVFDVECRDAKSGDGAFLAVTDSVGGKSLADVKDSFFVNQLVKPTGRFSFYGTPTDVKVTKSAVKGSYKIIDLSFSTLSQSTQTEIPRKARLAATIPDGSTQAVMLVASASALRWKKGSEKTIDDTISSFRAVPAPKSALKVRAKKRESSL